MAVSPLAFIVGASASVNVGHAPSAMQEHPQHLALSSECVDSRTDCGGAWKWACESKAEAAYPGCPKSCLVNSKGEWALDWLPASCANGGANPQPTQPPATQAPVTQPPATQSPIIQPPVTQPPATQAPAGGDECVDAATDCGNAWEWNCVNKDSSVYPGCARSCVVNGKGAWALDWVPASCADIPMDAGSNGGSSSGGGGVAPPPASGSSAYWSKISSITDTAWPVAGSHAAADHGPVNPDSEYDASQTSLEGTLEILNRVNWEEVLKTQDNKPSQVYKGQDLMTGIEVMVKRGMKLGAGAKERLWVGDGSSQGAEKGATNIALFLSQALHEAIQYDACDENNWDRPVAHGNYTSTSACGQVGQSYEDYDCPDACPMDKDMVILGSTHATWYGAPGPMYCGPKEIFPEGLMWDYAGAWRAEDTNSDLMNQTYGTKFEYLKRVIEPITNGSVLGATVDYNGQKDGHWAKVGAGSMISEANYSVPGWGSRTDVEGCCWWGRGVIQTTGRCNFGKLNKYLIQDFYNSDQNAGLDLCTNPQTICDNTEFPELKWNAGFFFWISEVQQYGPKNSATQWSNWSIPSVIDAWFAAGKPTSSTSAEWKAMIEGVSGIVNRGCPDLHACAAGDVHAFDAREEHFRNVLSKMGII